MGRYKKIGLSDDEYIPEWDFAHLKFSKDASDKRKRMNISLDQMAERIGVSKSTLSRMESGKAEWTINVLLNYCEILKIPLYSLKERYCSIL